MRYTACYSPTGWLGLKASLPGPGLEVEGGLAQQGGLLPGWEPRELVGREMGMLA